MWDIFVKKEYQTSENSRVSKTESAGRKLFTPKQYDLSIIYALWY